MIFKYFFVFNLFGYVIVSSLSNLVLSSDQSSPFSVILRAVIFLLSLIFIFDCVKSEKNFAKKYSYCGVLLFIFFFFFYILRLTYDFSLNSSLSNDKFYQYFLFSIFISFIPSLAMARRLAPSNLVDIFKLSLIVLSIGLGINLVLAISGFISGNSVESSRLSMERLSPIQIGKYSAFLFIISITLIQILGKSFRYWLSLVCLLSLISVLISGSRTAIVSVFCVYVINLFFFYGYRKLLISLIVLTVTICLYVYIAPFIFGDKDVFHLILNMGSVDDQSANIRFELYKGAFDQFTNSMLFGDYFLERTYMYSPHNLYLEILMSLGLTGFALFTLLVAISLSNIVKKIKLANPYNKFIYVGLLNLIIYLLFAGVFSLGITTAPELWSLLIVGLFLSYERKYDYNDSNSYI